MTEHSRFVTTFIFFLSMATWVFSADATREQVLKILKKTPLIDGHNDIAEQYKERVKNHLDQIDLRTDTSKLEKPMQTDIARLRAGGLGGQFWSVYVSVDLKGADAVQATMEQIDLIKRMVARYSDTFEMAYTAADVERIHSRGKIASLIGMEGGHSINNSLGALREMYRNGARYMTITHWSNTPWADSATAAPEHHGLTKFGELVIQEMNRLGMLVDLSHVSEETMNDVLDVTKAPVIFSHSSARALVPHPRNVPDAVLKRVATNGGVVMVNFAESFLSEECRQYDGDLEAETARLKELMVGNPDGQKTALDQWKTGHPSPKATLKQAADHIDHIRKVAGIDSIGIGSDFDGIPSVPVGLEDVSKYPDLFVELLRRGYTENDIRKIAGLNVLRVLKAAETVAAKLQKNTQPSDALIDEIDAAKP